MTSGEVYRAYRIIPPDARESYRRGDVDLDDILPTDLSTTQKRELKRLLKGQDDAEETDPNSDD